MPCINDMVNIKKYLKNVGITQKEFAERIGLSRPTLDTYIEMFESGQVIPKERYNIIFKRLFSVQDFSAKEFERNLQQIENLLNRDQKYGTSDLSPEAADYVSLIVRNMTKDFKTDDWNKDVYTFINILISNYHENEIFLHLVEYFIYLNNIREIEDIKESQKSYFANMFKTFHDLLEKPDSYDEADYQAFLNRCIEIKTQKKNKRDERNNNLKERIQMMVAEYEKKGIDLNEEEIIEEIKKQLVQENLNVGGI